MTTQQIEAAITARLPNDKWQVSQGIDGAWYACCSHMSARAESRDKAVLILGISIGAVYRCLFCNNFYPWQDRCNHGDACAECQG